MIFLKSGFEDQISGIRDATEIYYILWKYGRTFLYYLSLCQKITLMFSGLVINQLYFNKK